MIDANIRLMIHRITDLAIDVTAAGRYVADADFHGHVCQFQVTTRPVGQGYGSPGQYTRRIYLNQIGVLITPAQATGVLRAMLCHLEVLLAEGPATQEDQPS
ncbi:hypothetical protein [Halomonas koreensis]|uniref:Transcriptional regulator n=1 Tax=Halomonas koreensis TaxID=245385 RepID=A0ABU1G444_9GAMM|nr:hypothetical protein [Halomonas koreensis]MDR5867267.1 hypothetical protein [Halomonas koreensis]